MTAQRLPPCRGPYCAKLILLRIQFVRENLVCRTKSFTDPVLYGRPRPCRTKSESQASTSQLRQADRRQGKRKALARPNGAKARAGHPSDQTAPGQAQDTLRGKHPPGETPATTPPGRQVPRQTQGAPKAAHRGKLPPQLRQQTGTKANARRSLDQAAPRQTQDTLQTKRRQGNRRTPSRPNSANANAPHPPHQTAPRQTQGAPKAAHQGKLPPQLRQQTGTRARARRSPDQAATRQSQDTHQDKQRRGKHSPSKHPLGETPATTRQADRCQGKRKALARPSSARAIAGHPSDQTAPWQSQDTLQGKHPPSKPTKASNARPSSARYTNRNRQPPGRPAISVAEIRNY